MDRVRSVLQNLASALGGRDLSEEGSPYVLGDDGLGCLRDIKRWLQHYDEKKDVWDVKAALASMNIVATDLCPILASWTISEMNNEHKRRISLACVEILVPLTWPLELASDSDDYKVKQFPNLRLAQSGYKRSLLFDPENDILSSIMRVVYPSLATPRHARTERDTGILRLVLYLLRNLAAIDEGIKRSDTILAFGKANVLDFLCVLASGMGESFTTEDVILLDVIYLLIRGVRVQSLFEVSNVSSDSLKSELSDLLVREKDMRTNNRKQAHSRHNRFGTMVSVVQDSRRFTVASQTAILRTTPGNNFAGIEASKKWNSPHRQIKTGEDVDKKVVLNTEARLAIAGFVSTILDAGFNPLFLSLLKALEQDDTRISEANRVQFLYAQGWFFAAIREKGQSVYRQERKGEDFSDDADYSLVASMMENRATIMLRKMLRESIETKSWKEAHAAMSCLKELLLTINAMSLSSDTDYQDIAENLQSNLYYEEANLDLVATCVRTYTTQSLGYLDACTDLATVLLRMLEKYASTKTHMFVRARRQRQKRKKNSTSQTIAPTESDEEGHDAEAEARDAVKERAFNFAKFEAKFVNEHAVNTFMAFLQYYSDLSSEQIKRTITFFHRIFVKLKVEIVLYRAELFELLHRMINDKVGLPSGNPARIEVQTFTIYLIKRFSRTIEECPALAWEILFEKLSSDPYYLNHDQNKAPAERRTPRPPAEFVVRAGLSHEEQVKIAVGVLLDENKAEALDWLKDALREIVTRRYAWDAEQSARQESAPEGSDMTNVQRSGETLQPSSEDLRLQLFKDGKLRLLLKLISLERVGDRFDTEAVWTVPAYLETDVLDADLQLIKQYTLDPPQFDEGKTAGDYIRRQVPARVSHDSDSQSDSSSEDDDFDEAAKTKVVRERKPRVRAGRVVDDDELEMRKQMREQKEKERHGQIKSSKYVHDSDDEDDEAANAIFFAAEAALRERQKQRAAGLLMDPRPTSKPVKTKAQNTSSSDKENRALTVIDIDDGSSQSDHVMDESTESASRTSGKRLHGRPMKHGNALFVQDESEEELGSFKRTKLTRRNILGSDDDE